MDEGATTAERTERLLRMVWEEPANVVSQADEIDMIGHEAMDPGILLYFLRQGMTTDDLSRLSGDTRVLLPAATRGDDRARLAIDVFIHRLQAGIGAMLASLGDIPHALVFTDAIRRRAVDSRGRLRILRLSRH